MEYSKNVKCNYFTNGIDEQPGDQPIRVFYNLIEADFNGIRESLSKLKPSYNFENVRLEYLTENIKVIGPSTNGQKITIHDTFLSFLWSYIYGIVVLTPFGDKELTKEENEEARILIKYAQGLMTNYTYWDKEIMPNPEIFGKDSKRFIGVTNAVFLCSVQFILFHEFAHIFLEHTLVPNALRTPNNIKKMEIDADNVAIGWALQSFEDDFTGKIALISALNSLSFFPQKFSDSLTHPAPEDRIRMCLERLSIDDNDFIWGYATYSIMEWQVYNELFYLLQSSKKEENFKVKFYKMISELKEFKKTGKTIIKNNTN